MAVSLNLVICFCKFKSIKDNHCYKKLMLFLKKKFCGLLKLIGNIFIAANFVWYLDFFWRMYTFEMCKRVFICPISIFLSYIALLDFIYKHGLVLTLISSPFNDWNSKWVYGIHIDLVERFLLILLYTIFHAKLPFSSRFYLLVKENSTRVMCLFLYF